MRKYKEIWDPMDEIIGRYLSREETQPREDDLVQAIDQKYANIHWDVLYLKRQGKSPKEIQKILHIGEMSYLKAIQKLKSGGVWKEYTKK